MAKVVHRTTFQIVHSISASAYSDIDWVKYVKRPSPGLDDVISRSVLKRYWKVTGTAPTEDIGEMNPAEKNAADANDLPFFKIKLIDQIDATLNDRITDGAFEWPTSSGKFFPLRMPDQMRWAQYFAQRGSLTYPLVVVTKSGLQSHSIANAPEVASIYNEVVSFTRAREDAATAAKLNVAAAADHAAAQVAADAYLNP